MQVNNINMEREQSDGGAGAAGSSSGGAGGGDFGGFGLEEIGIPGRVYLRESLANCSEPLKAIEEFQAENEILLPSLKPMLPLLDLHGTRRLDFHTTVMEALRETLIAKINEIGSQVQVQMQSQKDQGTYSASKDTKEEKKLKDLLLKSFPVIKIKALRPVVLGILKNMPKINEKFLEVIVNDKELYDECDTEVKRQIWKENQNLFVEEINPILNQYIKQKEKVLFDHENKQNLFFSQSPKIRRQNELIKKLTHMIGRNVKLYDMVLTILRTVFLRTRVVHYCSLRAELLMALHDLEIQDIISVDPVHKFTWCMDACIREKHLDVKRSRELQGFLDSIKEDTEKILGDLSMILCDPYAINFLATNAMKLLHNIMNNESLPRDNQILILVLRMLLIGLSSWEMIHSQVFKEPKLDTHIVTKFLPALLSLMVDDQIRNVNAKLPVNERESALAIIDHSGPPPDAFSAFVGDSDVASVISMYYCIQLARNKDKIGLKRVLGCVSPTFSSTRIYDDPFFHTFVSLLIGMAEDFAAEDFCTVVFDEFICPGLPQENVTRHLLRLVYNVHAKLGNQRLDIIMKALQPSSMQNEPLRVAFTQLEEKIRSSSNEAVENMEIS